MRFLSALAVFLLLPLTGHAASLQAIEAYFNQLKTFQADFTQVDPDGGIAEGELFLKRPGRMRWNYTTPSEVVMITQGDNLLYYDKVMDEVSYLPLDDIAASMLIQSEVDFDTGDFKVVTMQDEAGITRLTLEQIGAPEQGQFTLVLRSQPMQLYSIILDQQGQVTRMSMSNIRQNAGLDDKVFDFKNPRGLVDPTQR